MTELAQVTLRLSNGNVFRDHGCESLQLRAKTHTLGRHTWRRFEQQRNSNGNEVF
jgi:hypothetical protein